MYIKKRITIAMIFIFQLNIFVVVVVLLVKRKVAFSNKDASKNFKKIGNVNFN